ncbi:MAG: S24/S26 family peptidase [Lentisphaerae bacterium]|nr:S24/S26 family peptidase [Lentisphaerota bacterium]
MSLGDTADSHPRLLALAPSEPAFAALVGDLLRDGCTIRFRADGRSMHPSLRAGDVLTVRRIETNRLRRGDVVLYQHPGAGVIAHRILARATTADGIRFHIRGDAAGGAPDGVQAREVLGLVIGLQREDSNRDLNSAAWRWLGLLRAWRQSFRHRLRRWRDTRIPPPASLAPSA